MELKAEQIEMLKQIHERGLTIFWSFQVPNATWTDTGERLNSNDLQLFRSMRPSKLVLEHVLLYETKTLTVITTHGGMKKTEEFLIGPDDSRQLRQSKVEYSGWHGEYGDDKKVSEIHNSTPHWQILEYEITESPYIGERKIDADEYTEEYGGLTFDYFLTDEGKRAAGISE